MAYNNMWSDLPPELLDEVVNRLEVPSDSWRLRSVCSSWRSSLPPRVFPNPLFPDDHLIMFQPSNSSSDYDDDDDDDFNNLNHQGCHVRLAKHTFFHLCLPQSRSTPKTNVGWLMKTEEHKAGVFHLFNPFSRTCAERMLMKHIPSPNVHFQRPVKLDVTNVKIRELGYEYVLHNVHNGYNLKVQDLHNMEHQKVALIKLPAFGDLHPHHRVDHINTCANSYAILSTHDTGKLLFYWSPLKEWSFLDHFSQLGYDDRSLFVNDWSLHYVDVAEYKGLFYAVTNSGRTVAIKLAADADDSSFVTVTLLTKSIIGGDKKFLVKVADNLLMVDLYTCPTAGSKLLKVHAIDIFKLETQEGRWVLVKNLGDHALFLSNHSCFSASTSVLPACKPNCIYFHFKNYSKEFCREKDNDNIDDDNDDDDDKPIWCSKDEIGVFDFEKGIQWSLGEHLEDSDLFSWPPPTWITWQL